ncbi:uncharacterized protein LOC114644085 isoform X3 [Erpetoichthys calabaricus]|uniref:uncharacterized protein LOC114644085 isoform X3 n=1 Tax=Erpetoichthys calabaricus TaxID=27687 RepID=UPI0022346A1A|nr:uncharacterized protein LOC114644085 isoform X3 [Erpetoichthys calabaricus]
MDFDALYNNIFLKVGKSNNNKRLNKIYCKPCRVLCRGQMVYMKHCNTFGHLETMKTLSTQGALLYILKYKAKTPVLGLQNVVVFSCINHPVASLIYYCRLCNFVEKNKFDDHMRSCHHQYLYIKTDCPEMITFECDNLSDQQVSTKIREAAQSIEDKYGIGELQELKVSFDKFSRLLEGSADVAEEIFLEEMEAKNKEISSQAESTVDAKSADLQLAKKQRYKKYKKTKFKPNKPEDCHLPLAANSVPEPTDHLNSQYMLNYEMGRRSEKQDVIPEWGDIVKRQRITAQVSTGVSSVNSPCQPVSNPLYFQYAADFGKMRGGKTVERGRYKHAGGFNSKQQRRFGRQMPSKKYAEEASWYAAAAMAQNGRTLSDATQGRNYIGDPSPGVQLSSWGTAASRSYAAGFPPYMFTSIASTGVLQNYRESQESGYQVTSHPLAMTSTPEDSKFRTAEAERSSSSKAKPDKLPPLDYLTLFKNMVDKASKKQEMKAAAVTQSAHKEEETQETDTPSNSSADYFMPEPEPPQTSSSSGYVRVRLGPDLSNTDRSDNKYIPSASSETFASLPSSHHSRDTAYSRDFQYPPTKAPFLDNRKEFQCDSQTPETSSSRGYVRVRLGPDPPKTGGSDQANSTFCSSKMTSFLPSSHQDSRHTYSSSSGPLADPSRHLDQMSQYKPEIPESSGSRGYMRFQLNP